MHTVLVFFDAQSAPTLTVPIGLLLLPLPQ